jgi:uncharacterized membrane protein YagU involved in acid resistance
MSKPVSVITRGAAAGAFATVCMTPVMLPSRGPRGRGSIPPEKITKEVLKSAGARNPKGPKLAILTAIAHLAFGAAAGSAFALLRTTRAFRRLPPTAFGFGIWFLGYQVVLPALGLIPKPTDDRPSRVRSNIAAHLVYGAVLGASLPAGNDLFPQVMSCSHSKPLPSNRESKA